MLTIKPIESLTKTEMEQLRSVMLEYGDHMYIDLALVAGKQRFAYEMLDFPGGRYVKPDGAFFLALYEGRPAGCIGIKRYDNDTCEMKRMYVKPEFRQLGIGVELCRVAIDTAKDYGYASMLLDTNKEMPAAISIYDKLGFTEIPAYCENENPNPVYYRYELV